MAHAVEVAGLRKSYGEKQAVDGLDLHVAHGEVVAILGPNGAGKTTTVEILEGYRSRDGGEVRVLGQDPQTGDRAWRSRLGIVLQTNNDLAEATVAELVRHFARFFPNPKDPDEVIVSVGLQEKVRTRARQLSGGQRRRLDVALGIVGRPELLFLDEPTTGFDPQARRSFWDLVESLAADGTTILLTTHYLEEAERLADRVVVVRDGQVVAEGPPADLGGRTARQAVVRWTQDGESREVRTDSPTQTVVELTRSLGGEIPGLQVLRPTLEDVYLGLIADGGPVVSVVGTRTRQPSILSLGLARTGYEVRTFFRERDAVVFIFAYPIIMLAIFATVFGQNGATVGPEPGIPFAQYFLPGMVATGVMLSSFQHLAISVAVERDDGGLKRLHGTPLPPAAFFLGKTGEVLLTSLIQTALLLAVAALLFDVPMPTTATAWATFAWVFALGTAAGTLAGVAFSSVPRSGKSASAVVTPVVLVLQFISGVFFVFNDLPTWMQQVASVFPLKWMAQGMRSVFLPPSAETWEVSGSWQHGATAAVLLVWAVGALVVGIRTFRWQRRDDG